MQYHVHLSQIGLPRHHLAKLRHIATVIHCIMTLTTLDCHLILGVCSFDVKWLLLLAVYPFGVIKYRSMKTSSSPFIPHTRAPHPTIENAMSKPQRFDDLYPESTSSSHLLPLL
jgi:hypothetical protein